MSECGRRQKITRIFLAVAVCLVFLVAAVSAGEKYISGSPALSASIYGANEFYPGTEADIPVILQNSGLIEYVFTYPTTITPADLPNTAKLMTVELLPGNAPLTILSDPQMVGDLKGGDNMIIHFRARTGPDAPAGTYDLPLRIRYTFLAHADQYGQDTLQYFYQDKEVMLDVPFRIRPEILLQVVSTEPEDVNVGTEGFVRITLKNIGNEDGTEAIVKLLPVGNSPVQPVASSIYIGDFPMKSEISLKYKITVSKDAEALTYPVNVSVTYKNRDGQFVTSEPAVIGIPVQGKIRFTVVSPPPGVNPGSQSVIEVTYENTGAAPVYAAQARLYTRDPFTSSDDTSYLGDIAPGETGTARFRVSVDQKATVKEYALDSEIQYRDALDNDQVSDRIKVPVRVVNLTGVMAVLLNPFFIVLVVVAVIASVIVLRRQRKKRSA